eukprot:CAMPEP_0119331600 /NCGR_PEP_ID=MMETSP1333-20130426/80915_1 /TAXON_ID=418940 /ORGANISM="Scyphosphaera apsteinii, Strain RCC1455" /LENGTH=652 /DNA_ID=CAMNT_0007341239 /DNA_START=84 /DNA_END=2042 /DNA_ORIENTATION=-
MPLLQTFFLSFVAYTYSFSTLPVRLDTNQPELAEGSAIEFVYQRSSSSDSDSFGHTKLQFDEQNTKCAEVEKSWDGKSQSACKKKCKQRAENTGYTAAYCCAHKLYISAFTSGPGKCVLSKVGEIGTVSKSSWVSGISSYSAPSPPLPPLSPLPSPPPPSPPTPPAPPPSLPQYSSWTTVAVQTSQELKAALEDDTRWLRIVLAGGIYYLNETLVIDRDVILEAEQQGAAVLQGAITYSVISISGDHHVVLSGLNITSGCEVALPGQEVCPADQLVHSDRELTAEELTMLNLDGRGWWCMVWGHFCGATAAETMMYANCPPGKSFFSSGNVEEGGGIRIELGTHGEVHIRQCNLYGNRARVGGGAYVSGGTVAFTDCNIFYNFCTSPFERTSDTNYAQVYGGGGAYVQNGDVTFNGCNIFENRASGLGGGVCIFRSTVLLSGCRIFHNFAFFMGGGIYFQNEYGSFIGLYASGEVKGMTLKLYDCDVFYNRLGLLHTEWGGVPYKFQAGLSDVDIWNGGGVAIVEGWALFTRTNIYHNTMYDGCGLRASEVGKMIMAYDNILRGYATYVNSTMGRPFQEHENYRYNGKRMCNSGCSMQSYEELGWPEGTGVGLALPPPPPIQCEKCQPFCPRDEKHEDGTLIDYYEDYGCSG